MWRDEEVISTSMSNSGLDDNSIAPALARVDGRKLASRAQEQSRQQDAELRKQRDVFDGWNAETREPLEKGGSSLLPLLRKRQRARRAELTNEFQKFGVDNKQLLTAFDETVRSVVRAIKAEKAHVAKIPAIAGTATIMVSGL